MWAFDPNEVALALKDDRVSEEMRRWLLVSLVAADSKHLHFLGELADPQKVDAVHAITY